MAYIGHPYESQDIRLRQNMKEAEICLHIGYLIEFVLRR